MDSMNCEAARRELATLVDRQVAGVVAPSEELADHLEGCADCRRHLEELRGTADALASLGEVEAPAGWKERTWERIHSEADAEEPAGAVYADENRPGERETPSPEERSPATFWRPLAAAAGLLALVLAVALWDRGPTVPDQGIEITVLRDQPLRGDQQAAAGDQLRIHVPATGDATEIRVYRDDRELIHRCGVEVPCATVDGRVEAVVALERRGTVQVLVLRGEAPPPTGDLDTDAAAAVRAGVEVEMPPRIEVR